MSITPDGGLEPSTTWLKVKRSTDWANRVYTLGGIRTHEEMNQQILSLPRLTAPEPVFVKILYCIYIGWDSNPRRNESADLKPAPFDRSGTNVYKNINFPIRDSNPGHPRERRES